LPVRGNDWPRVDSFNCSAARVRACTGAKARRISHHPPPMLNSAAGTPTQKTMARIYSMSFWDDRGRRSCRSCNSSNDMTAMIASERSRTAALQRVKRARIVTAFPSSSSRNRARCGRAWPRSPRQFFRAGGRYRHPPDWCPDRSHNPTLSPGSSCVRKGGRRSA